MDKIFRCHVAIYQEACIFSPLKPILLFSSTVMVQGKRFFLLFVFVIFMTDKKKCHALFNRIDENFIIFSEFGIKQNGRMCLGTKDDP